MKKKWSILDNGPSFEEIKAVKEYITELARLNRAAEDKYLEDRHKELFE